MVAAVQGDFDVLKWLYDAKNKVVFRKGDRFCDLRRERAKFMRSWRVATRKPLSSFTKMKERRIEAVCRIQDMVRTQMEARGLWDLPCPYGHVIEIERTKFGNKMIIEYEDKQRTRDENFQLEFQHLQLVVRTFISFLAAVHDIFLHKL